MEALERGFEGLLAMRETIEKSVEQLREVQAAVQEIRARQEEESSEHSDTIPQGETHGSHNGGRHKVDRWRKLEMRMAGQPE